MGTKWIQNAKTYRWELIATDGSILASQWAEPRKEER